MATLNNEIIEGKIAKPLISFTIPVIMAIVNSLGVIESAGVGVAEKLCGFIMLVPSAFSQAVATFVAQNVGAGKGDRARKVLWVGLATPSSSFVQLILCMMFFIFIGKKKFFSDTK